MMAMPVVTSVSQATRLVGSCARRASRMESEIWSAILSGCPSVTDSDVNRWLPSRLIAVCSLNWIKTRGRSRYFTPITTDFQFLTQGRRDAGEFFFVYQEICF